MRAIAVLFLVALAFSAVAQVPQPEVEVPRGFHCHDQVYAQYQKSGVSVGLPVPAKVLKFLKIRIPSALIPTVKIEWVLEDTLEVTLDCGAAEEHCCCGPGAVALAQLSLFQVIRPHVGVLPAEEPSITQEIEFFQEQRKPKNEWEDACDWTGAIRASIYNYTGTLGIHAGLEWLLTVEGISVEVNAEGICRCNSTYCQVHNFHPEVRVPSRVEVVAGEGGTFYVSIDDPDHDAIRVVPSEGARVVMVEPDPEQPPGIRGAIKGAVVWVPGWMQEVRIRVYDACGHGRAFDIPVVQVHRPQISVSTRGWEDGVYVLDVEASDEDLHRDDIWERLEFRLEVVDNEGSFTDVFGRTTWQEDAAHCPGGSCELALLFDPPADWDGEATLRIEVCDFWDLCAFWEGVVRGTPPRVYGSRVTMWPNEEKEVILLVQDPDTSLSDLEAYFTTPEGINVLEHWFEEAPVYYGSHFGDLLVVKLRTESIPAGPYEVGVRVTDGDLSGTAIIHIEVLNAPPEVHPEKKVIARGGGGIGARFMAWEEDPPCFTFTDANGDELSFDYEDPRYGHITSLTVSPEPSLGESRYRVSVLYEPPSDLPELLERYGYELEDTFRVIGSDGEAEAAAEVVVHLTNRPPEPKDLSFEFYQGPVEIELSATDPDGDRVEFAVVEPPRYGTPEGTPPKLTYHPGPELGRSGGVDSFVYAASDGMFSAEARVTLVLLNRPPEPGDDLATTTEGEAVVIDVLANDTDPDGDPLEIVGVSPPEHGTAEVQGERIRYQPEPGFCGEDSFSYTVEDAHGARAEARVEVEVLDDEPPRFVSVPDDIEVCNDAGSCRAVLDPGWPEVEDNCNCRVEVTGVRSDDLPLDAPYPVGLTEITWRAVDFGGHEITHVQRIRVRDCEPPTIVCPADLEVPTDPGSCSARGVDLGEPGVGDNCGISSVENDAPDVFPVGETAVTWAARDAAGNEARCVQIVRVVDEEAPVALARDVTVELDESGRATISPADVDAGSHDNCGPVELSLDRTEFGCSDLGENWVTLTVTDAGGNTASTTATVTVVDRIPPVVITRDVTVELDESGQATISPADIDAGSYDNCGIVTMALDRDSFGCADIGENLVTLTATDQSGNTASATATVTVVDRIPPELVVPPDVTLECGEPTDPDHVGWATATDNCDPAPTISYVDEVQGGCPTVVVRTWVATDAEGNEARGIQRITLVDTGPPELVVPPDVEVECGEPTDPDHVGWATASDDCDPDPEVTYTDEIIPGPCAQAYTIERTWRAEDSCGHIASGVQTITVRDTTPPVLSVPDDVEFGCVCVLPDTSPEATGWATARDNCDPDPMVGYSDREDTDGDLHTITRTWTATDSCGNSVQGQQTIAYTHDTTPPETVCPDDITVYVHEPPGSTVWVEFEATAADSCDPSPRVECDPRGDYFTVGDTELVHCQCTAADRCGNEATELCGFWVTVEVENEPPVAQDDYAEFDGVAVYIPVLANDHDWDGDDLAIVSVSDPQCGNAWIEGDQVVYTTVGWSDTCAPPSFGMRDTFTYTITDGYGGYATATVYVTIKCQICPTALPPEEQESP